MQSARMQILTTVFLACFCIYAVSPLAGTLPERSISGERDSRPAIRIFLVQVFLDSVLNGNHHEPAQSEDDEDGDSWLVKKKRAVLSKQGFQSLIALFSVDTVSPETGLTLDWIGISSHESDRIHSPAILQPLHSGNSPPSV